VINAVYIIFFIVYYFLLIFHEIFRRSLSPIAIRPSCLGPVKRKFELDETGMDHNLQPPVKRTSGLLTSVASRLRIFLQ